MKLLDSPFSPFARKVRMVLEHKGLAFDTIDALLKSNHDVLHAANSRLEVPALIDGDITVINSADIVAYLEHRYPQQPVYPEEPAERVTARAWERTADTLIDAARYATWLAVTPVLAAVLLTVWPSFRRSTLRVLPRGHLAWRGEEYLHDVNSALAGYIRAQSAAAAIVGVMCVSGFVLIGVPSNDFGSQEPGGVKEIEEPAQHQYGVTFPITAKTVVRGA